jgi:hypothetical protein
VRTVETIGETQQESERLFDVGFWLECEHEAARMLRTMTGVDDGHLTLPAGVAAP